jgi:long-chain fatty acid transport protein
MKLPTKQTLVFAFALALTSPATVFATNGMNMIGYGAKATGMGGAGVAYPQDAMAAAYNPASITEVGHTRLDATLELFYPPRAVRHESDTLGMTDVASKDNLFPIPAIGAVMSDPSIPLAMGMAVVGAGLGTNYVQNSDPNNCVPNFFNPCATDLPYNRVGVFLMQMQMLPTFAFRLNENHSVGASIVIAAQTFRAYGLESFGTPGLGFTTSSGALTNNGFDWSFGWGYRLGWFGKFFDQKLNLGLAYAPRVEMQKFNRYSGLFANHGEFDIPPVITAGFAYKFTPKFNMAFDVQRIYWSEIDSIGNAGPNVNSASDFNPNGICGISASNPTGNDGISPECNLGGDLGMGFGWTNQTVYKLGFDYKYSKDLTLRAGYNYGKSPIPSDQVLFNMLAPATTEKHITLGVTKALDQDSDFTFTFMHAFRNTIKGPTVFPPALTTGDNAAITMQQTSLSFAYGLRF